MRVRRTATEYQFALTIHPNMRLHPKIPSPPLARQVQLLVTSLRLILGRGRSIRVASTMVPFDTNSLFSVKYSFIK